VIVAYQNEIGGELEYVIGTLDGPAGTVDVEFGLARGLGLRGRYPAVAFDDRGGVIILYENPGDHELWYVHGAIQDGRIKGQRRPLTSGTRRR
jgi:hypothetical protein